MSSDLKNEGFRIRNKLIKYIKCNSHEKIVTILTRIKTDSKCQKQFTKDKHLNLFIDLLHFQNIEIVSLTLSLLANMCLAIQAREQLHDSRIATYTLWIIQNLEGDNNLHCRAVRLIGNLSECDWHAKSFYEAGAVEVLNDLLHSTVHTEIYEMTIRAFRNIWNSYRNSRISIIQSGAITRIMTLFAKSIEKSYEPKHAGLVKTCLKAMCVFADSLDYQCALQMCDKSNEEGFTNIVKLCEQNNALALKCLYNLSRIAECRPTLGGSGIIERLLRLITNTEQLSWEILATLCHFCREAINRVRIRLSSGLEVMISLLKIKENDRFHPMILHALSLFTYDENAMGIMVKNGLLDVLVEKLTIMIKAAKLRSKEEREFSRKRSRESSPFSKTDLQYKKRTSERFSLDYRFENWSPNSGASTSSSPPSTPPLALYNCENMDDSAEENYSPVCSDDEWDEKVQEMNLQDKFDSSVTEHMNIWTLTLLTRLCDSNEPIDKLADPSIIKSLSSYIKFTKDSKALRILTKISKNSSYLVPLIQQGFVFEAQTMFGSEQCIQELSIVAETGGAVGQLSAILLRGKEVNKNFVAVSIPFIIKSKEMLRCLLNNHGGMPVIFHILSDREHILHENAILSISRLADSLDIRPNNVDWNELLIESNIEKLDIESCDNFSKPSTVTFQLDDGTTVDACRRTLCQKSDYFSVMLKGNFMEAGKRRVRLKDTSKASLNILLLAADGAEFHYQTIEELLDAVLLAHKFLMPRVLEILIKNSLSRLNYDNFSRAWNWTRNYSPYFHACSQLKTFCLETFLTSRLTRTERLQAFRDFSDCNGFLEFLEDVREILISGLSQR